MRISVGCPSPTTGVKAGRWHVLRVRPSLEETLGLRGGAPTRRTVEGPWSAVLPAILQSPLCASVTHRRDASGSRGRTISNLAQGVKSLDRLHFFHGDLHPGIRSDPSAAQSQIVSCLASAAHTPRPAKIPERGTCLRRLPDTRTRDLCSSLPQRHTGLQWQRFRPRRTHAWDILRPWRGSWPLGWSYAGSIALRHGISVTQRAVDLPVRALWERSVCASCERETALFLLTPLRYFNFFRIWSSGDGSSFGGCCSRGVTSPRLSSEPLRSSSSRGRSRWVASHT